MKTAIRIWIVAGLVVLGSTLYINHSIDRLIQENTAYEARTARVTGFNSLEVVNNYSEQKTADVHVLEPKVSDRYYQNTIDVNQLQQAKYEHNTNDRVL